MAYASYDVVVIGAGPGGEVGAIRAAQLGLKVALVEKHVHLGGTCLNFGCIPTKALIESAKVWTQVNSLANWGLSAENPRFQWDKILERKDDIVNQQRKGLLYLMKKNKITVFEGTGQLVEKDLVEITSPGGKERIRAKNVLLCTGSKVRELPGVQSDGKRIFTSDSILSIDHVPKRMVIIGGGVVGMEFASLFGRFGCEVTVVEMQAQILPTEDAEVVADLVKLLRKQQVKVITQAAVSKVSLGKNAVTVAYKSNEGETHEIEVDVVLTSIGRLPQIEGVGLEALGVQREGPFLKVDRHYRTSVDNIFAVGDIINTPALAHTASAEGKHAAEVIAGLSPHPIDYSANPSGIYTYPEIASIGLTESQLKKDAIPYLAVKFPFAPLAKAKIEHARDGFIKILYEPTYKEILGVHILGARATELISEFVLAKLLEGTVDDIGHAIHPHPTIAETIMEAAHMADGGGIHL